MEYVNVASFIVTLLIGVYARMTSRSGKRDTAITRAFIRADGEMQRADSNGHTRPSSRAARVSSGSEREARFVAHVDAALVTNGEATLTRAERGKAVTWLWSRADS